MHVDSSGNASFLRIFYFLQNLTPVKLLLHPPSHMLQQFLEITFSRSDSQTPLAGQILPSTNQNSRNASKNHTHTHFPHNPSLPKNPTFPKNHSHPEPISISPHQSNGARCPKSTPKKSIVPARVSRSLTRHFSQVQEPTQAHTSTSPLPLLGNHTQPAAAAFQTHRTARAGVGWGSSQRARERESARLRPAPPRLTHRRAARPALLSAALSSVKAVARERSTATVLRISGSSAPPPPERERELYRRGRVAQVVRVRVCAGA